MKKLTALFVAIAVMASLFLAVVPATAQDGGEGQVMPISMDHPAAPFIESYLYAINAGATAEFRKMEGVVPSVDGQYLYLAMSEINKGMSDEEGDVQATNNDCGIVYRAELGEDYNISNLHPYIVGGPYDEEADPDNACNVDAIANPDGLTVDTMGRVWVAEDTGDHLNNVLWAYDPADGSLKRFATVPVGAEVTGARIAPDGSLFFNVQHPSPYALYPYNRGIIGVVKGFNANEDSFEAIDVPQGDDQLTVVVPEGMEYQVLGRAGDPIPSAPDGAVFGELIRVDGTTQGICNQPDGNMYLPLNEAGTEGYLMSNFECRPGTVSKMYIVKDDMGTWNVLEGERVNFDDVMGTWNNCNASVSPWNTGLTSEEYPSEDMDDWMSGSSSGAMNDYLGATANPYDYGYIVELIPTSPDRGFTQVYKHYAMGRFSMEQTAIMADGKTAYYGDDGSDRILFKFVAEEAGDLGYGTLYAAKVTQLEDESFDIEWIELGTGDDVEIYEHIRALDVYFE